MVKGANEAGHVGPEDYARSRASAALHQALLSVENAIGKPLAAYTSTGPDQLHVPKQQADLKGSTPSISDFVVRL